MPRSDEFGNVYLSPTEDAIPCITAHKDPLQAQYYLDEDKGTWQIEVTTCEGDPVCAVVDIPSEEEAKRWLEAYRIPGYTF